MERPTTDTAVPTEPRDTALPASAATVLSASCTRPDHPLRIRCHITVAPRGTPSLALSWEGGERRVEASESAESHQLDVALLPESTPIQWTVWLDGVATEHNGTVLTGLLNTVQRPVPSLQGALGSAVTFRDPCLGGTRAWAVDGQGRVIAVQDLAQGFKDIDRIEALTWTDEGTWVAILDEHTLVEWSVDGGMLWSLGPDSGWAGRLHHDVFTTGDHVYVLFEDEREQDGRIILSDGFHVIERRTGVVDTWSLWDHLRPTRPESWPDGPAPVDWSHANGVFVDTNGNALVSLRHLSTIVSVAADPKTEDFGTVAWMLAGDPSGEVVSDLALVTEDGEGTFLQQHHPQRLPDGTLSLFDNRSQLDELSRVLRISLTSDTATVTSALSLDAHCDFQGGVYWRDEVPLATCAPASRLQELDPRNGAVTAELEVSCSSGSTQFIPRFIPID